MMEGTSQVDIARRLGVDRVTVGRWYERDDFKAALNEQMAAVQGAVNAEIRDAQLKAIDTITAILDDPESSERARIEASKYILDKAASLPPPPPVQGIHTSEVLMMLDELETGYDDIIDGMMGAMLEQAGFCTADEYRTMNPVERLALAIANEQLLVILNAAAVGTDDLDFEGSNLVFFIEEQCRHAKEHPEWVEAANHRWATQMERYQQFINSDEYQQYITETGHATEAKTE